MYIFIFKKKKKAISLPSVVLTFLENEGWRRVRGGEHDVSRRKL